MAELTAEQLSELKVYATAAAYAFHQSSIPEGDRVDLAASFAVHKDLRLVAADLLEAACLYARTHPATTQVAAAKRIKLGPIELERANSTRQPADQVSADAWCALAARLRDQASSQVGLIRSPLAGMISGSNPNPVFSITRDERGRP